MWEELTNSFSHTFSFLDKNSFIHNALQDNYDTVLEIFAADETTMDTGTTNDDGMLQCVKRT